MTDAAVLTLEQVEGLEAGLLNCRDAVFVDVMASTLRTLIAMAKKAAEQDELIQLWIKECNGYAKQMLEADAANVAAVKRIAELEEALLPFVKWIAPAVKLGDELQPDLVSYEDDCEVDFDDLHNPGFAFLWCDLRRAARALPAAQTETA